LENQREAIGVVDASLRMEKRGVAIVGLKPTRTPRATLKPF